MHPASRTLFTAAIGAVIALFTPISSPGANAITDSVTLGDLTNPATLRSQTAAYLEISAASEFTEPAPDLTSLDLNLSRFGFLHPRLDALNDTASRFGSQSTPTGNGRFLAFIAAPTPGAAAMFALGVLTAISGRRRTIAQ